MRPLGARSFCHAKLPTSGLGNKLLVWAKAYVFARLNALPLISTNWLPSERIPSLHGRFFRFYFNYFKTENEVGLPTRLRAHLAWKVDANPPVQAISVNEPTVFRFTSVPHWADYFGDLKPHRDAIRSGLLSILTETRQRELARLTSPRIALQVRMSDFRPLEKGEDFKTVGGVRTPLEYFIGLVRNIRRVHGSPLPVRVFSDGSAAELRELLSEPGVQMAPVSSAIADIFLMSRSDILIPSAGSTFGYWGAFLGNNTVILHPDHIHETIRPAELNRSWYEGPAVGDPAQWPALLLGNIRNIE